MVPSLLCTKYGKMEGPREYSHQKVMSKIDDLKKSLGDLQDKLLKESVRAQILQVDLATQFNPHMVEAVSSAVDSCEQCASTTSKLLET